LIPPFPGSNPGAPATQKSRKIRASRPRGQRAHRAHSRPTADQLPGAGAVPSRRARPHAVRSMSRGAACPDEPPTQADQSQTCCTASGLTPIRQDRTTARVRRPDVKKSAAWCMIRANRHAPVTPSTYGNHAQRDGNGSAIARHSGTLPGVILENHVPSLKMTNA
jgi:hypothetical protein